MPSPPDGTEDSKASGRGLKLLEGAVGVHCRNSPYDVESVQRLLNINIERIAPVGPLQCDGRFGSKTSEAICAFQRIALSQAEPSGTVGPDDATMAALCACLPQSLDEQLMSILYLNAVEQTVTALTPSILDTMARYEVGSPLRQAHFLAQVGHESGELLYRKEIASGAAYEHRKDLGNTQPGDGPRYKGRGLIQLTGRANYAEYSRTGAFRINVESDPEQLAADDRLCVDVAGWFWRRHSLNALADRDDLEAITRRINGGLNGLDNRRRLLLRAKTLLGA